MNRRTRVAALAAGALLALLPAGPALAAGMVKAPSVISPTFTTRKPVSAPPTAGVTPTTTTTTTTSTTTTTTQAPDPELSVLSLLGDGPALQLAVPLTTPVWEDVMERAQRPVLELPVTGDPGIGHGRHMAADLDEAFLDAVAGTYNGSPSATTVIHPESITYVEIEQVEDVRAVNPTVQFEFVDEDGTRWGGTLWYGVPTGWDE
jgi:hypothetical protein